MTTLIPKYTKVTSANRTIAEKFSESISVKDFGAIGDGTTNDTTAINNAIAYAVANEQPTINFPSGEYLVTSTIVIDHNGVCLQGESSRVSGNSVTGGPVNQLYGTRIKYTGTGAAILVSRVSVTPVPPESTNFIENICIRNMQINCTNAATYGLHCIKPVGGIFENLTIVGILDTSGAVGNARNSCIRLEAGVDNIFRFIDMNGSGDSDVTHYANGLTSTVYLGEPVTTTVFEKCYFHYNYTNYIDSTITFYNCIFEVCNADAVYLFDNSQVSFYSCWWEANLSFQARFGIATYTKFFNCYIANTQTSNLNAYFAVRTSSGGRNQLEINGCNFITHGSQPLQRLFPDGVPLMRPDVPSTMTITNTVFPSAFYLGTVLYGDYRKVKHNDMSNTTFSFIKTAAGTGHTETNPLPAESGNTNYVMPQDGHILGVNVYASGALGGGTFNTAVYVNGVLAVAQLPGSSDPEAFYYYDPYQYVVNEGDIVTVYLQTDNITTAVKITVDLVVALGSDGRGIVPF
jgi:hypothetical protein